MLRRREALALPAALLSQGLVNAAALTQPMPYVLVVPTPAGGPVDRVARALAPELSLALEGAPVVVDNRPGAAGKIGVQAARRAARDGRTLLAVSPSIVSVNPVVDKEPGFDPLSDLDYLGIVAASSGVVAVRSGLPVKSIHDLLRHGQALAGNMTYGSFGGGTSLHLQSEELLERLKLRARHIPYQGDAQLLQALAGGEIDVVFYATQSVIALVQSGRVRAIATTGAQRWPLLPQVPGLNESGLPALRDYHYQSWVGLALPVGGDPARRSQLQQAFAAASASTALRQRLAEQGFEPATGDLLDMRETVSREIQRNRAVVSSGRVTLE